jgi:hypothetical protein
MRHPGFPITFASGRADSIVISLRTADRHPARALLEEGILRSSIVDFARALIAAQGRAGSASVDVAAPSRHVIAITLPDEVFTAGWQIASVFNLIDNAIFIGQEEDPVITSATVSANRFADLTIESAQQQLADHVAMQQSMLVERLSRPGGSILWPEQPADVFFTITLTTSPALPGAYHSSARTVFSALCQALSDSAFEPETPPVEWLEDLLVPYPFDIAFDNAQIRIDIETPPSDPAIVVMLFEDALRTTLGAEITRWELALREAW